MSVHILFNVHDISKNISGRKLSNDFRRNWFEIHEADCQKFLEVLEDPVIKAFLFQDACYVIADRYLLAMVFVYFRKGIS